jgi:hypothetical protein
LAIEHITNFDFQQKYIVLSLKVNMNRQKIFACLFFFSTIIGILPATIQPSEAATVTLSRGYKGKVCVDIGNSSSNREVRVTWGNWNYQGRIPGKLTGNALIEMNSRGYVDSFMISAYSRHRQGACPNTFFWNDWNLPPGSTVYRW